MLGYQTLEYWNAQVYDPQRAKNRRIHFRVALHSRGQCQSSLHQSATRESRLKFL
jgi:hypothetical protein